MTRLIDLVGYDSTSLAHELQLNRGEHRHALTDRLFFGNQCEFRTGDREEMMNKVSALSLLSNAVRFCFASAESPGGFANSTIQLRQDLRT